MEKIAVYGTRAELPLPVGYDVEYIRDLVFPESTDCLIVSCSAAGDSTAQIIAAAKRLGIPVIAASTDMSLESQERLLELGADDVSPLPINEELLAKRIDALFCYSDDSVELLPDFLDFEDITVENGGKGSFKVHQHDFLNLYRFVLRLLERVNESAQMLLFTLKCDTSAECGQTEYDELTTAVQKCLRRGDISSKCGDGKIIVLLIGANDEGGHLAANRIISNFYSRCDNEQCSLNYDIREIKLRRRGKG